MIIRGLLAAAAIVVVGCGSGAPAPTSTTLVDGQGGLVTFAAGRYRFDWSSSCTTWYLELAPTAGGPPIEISTEPTGSAVVDVPAGPAYVNRGGSCPSGFTVTISPAR